MKMIKGLMIKDLLQLKSYKRTLLVFILVFVATSLTQEKTKDLLVVMMTLGFGMFSIATFSYDEMAKADRYILTFPLTKKEVVKAKYSLVITSTIVGSIIGMIINIILSLSLQKEMPNLLELVSLAMGAIFGIGIVEAIQIPFIYKYGAEKGRIQIFIAIAIIAFVLGGIIWIGEKYGINWMGNSMVEMFSKILPIILIASIAIIYFISYKISCKIYKRKEV